MVLSALLYRFQVAVIDNFKRNARATGWLQEVLTDAGVGSLEENAQWTIQHLGDVYSDSFIAAACNLGVLLHSKEMDAESTCAMWEEANVALQGQRIILRHLGKFFGHRSTVPEQKIRELELGALLPISCQVREESQ
jgi:hypothetical protein